MSISISERINGVVNTTETIISSMSNGERIQLKELAARAKGNSTLDPKDVLSIVSMIARNTDAGYVARGKNGGFIRGTKEDKVAVKSKTTDNSSTSDSDEDDDFDSDEE